LTAVARICCALNKIERLQPTNQMKNTFVSIAALALALALLPLTAVAGWNVLEAGAQPDGKTDCTAVFQKLLDQAGKAGGGVVDVPAGQYRINTGLSIPANVTLQGIFNGPPTSGPVAITNLTGSVLFAYAGRGATSGPPFIKLAGGNAAIAGLSIAYPEWKQTDVPPVPYPPCVSSEDTENIVIRDCLLLNPYEAIRLVRAHRHLVRNITGYPIKRGIYVDECYDIGHIENIHFWPFGVSFDPNNPFCKWVNTEGVAFEWARTDWHYVLNTFCFGYGIGYKFSNSAHGSANGNFVGLGADSCQRAVVVDQAQPPGLLISNGEFVGRWGSTNAVCLEIGPEVEGKVSLVNCSFWGPIDHCVWMRSKAGQFTASACNFVNWDNAEIGSPAIQLDAGRAIIQGCTFGEDHLHIQVRSNVVSAILTANQAPGGFRFENDAGPRAQAALNEADPISWSRESLARYHLQIGGVADGRYLLGWCGAEKGPKPYRWSLPGSKLVLPVIPGERYTLRLEFQAPQAALSAEAGIYHEGVRLAPLTTNGVMTVELPPATTNRMRLELRCKAWVPAQVNKDSHDQRALGIQVFALTMHGAAADTNVFSANTGEWISSAPDAQKQ
jgi:hypothetical protein